MRLQLFIKAALMLVLGIAAQYPLRAQKGQLAITIDDLPTVSRYPLSPAQKRAMTLKTLQALKAHHAPAIGFVNEGKMYNSSGQADTAQVGLLDMWLRYGMELGNHTLSHMDYNTHSLSDFAKDITAGELITRPLLAKYGRKLECFRHPFLHRGNSKEKADSLAAFLQAHAYKEAPVTIDNSDWIFARAYDSVLLINDTAQAHQLGRRYVSYMESKLVYYEAQARLLSDKPIRQILLIHLSRLNADNMDALLDMYKRHGYTFITLKEALKDKIYQSEDHFYKRAGISWIHRWAITRKIPSASFQGEPVVDPDVMKLADVMEE